MTRHTTHSSFGRGPRTDRSGRPVRPERGFTVVELLVALTIILVIAALLLVALNGSRRKAQEANTRSLLRAMVDATVRFETDHGYAPPSLTWDRNAIAYPPLVQRVADPEDWRENMYVNYSVTSPAEYLIGWDVRGGDGYGGDAPGTLQDEIPAIGIRTPGPDGLWGAGSFGGAFVDRQPQLPENGGPGKVYGPYLDVDVSDLLAVTDGTRSATTFQFNVFFPGDPGYDDTLPRVICDYWGNAIEYMRLPHPLGVPGQAFRAGDYDNNGTRDAPPSLSDWVRLRPWELDAGGGVDSIADGNGDTTSSSTLQAGGFAYFSAGPDGLYAPRNGDIRIDEAELNRDNLVEVGP